MKTTINSLCLLFSLSIVMGVHADKPTSTDNKTAQYEVKYRKAAFQMIKYHFRPLGDMSKGKHPFDSEKAKYHADALAVLSTFPAEGFQTKRLTDDSSALEKIWDEPANFQKIMLEFQKAMKDLSNNVDSQEQLKIAFADATKTCKGCHDQFRVKKK